MISRGAFQPQLLCDGRVLFSALPAAFCTSQAAQSCKTSCYTFSFCAMLATGDRSLSANRRQGETHKDITEDVQKSPTRENNSH